MKNLLIVLALFLAGCAGQATEPAPDTMTQRDAYHRLARPLMALVADEMDKPPAPIPQPEFRDFPDDVHAVYHSERDIVFLPTAWQADHAGVAAMAHEFAHAVQAHDDPERAQRHLDVIRDIRAGRIDGAYDRLDRVWRECLENEREAYAVHRWYLLYVGDAEEYPEAWLDEFARDSCVHHRTARDKFAQEESDVVETGALGLRP